jgi:hypothetical protein
MDSKKIESLEIVARQKVEQLKAFSNEMDLVEVYLPESLDVVAGKLFSIDLKGSDIYLIIIPPYEMEKVSVKLMGGEKIAFKRTKIFRI